MRTFPKLSATAFQDGSPSRPLDTCVVTSELLGPVKNGGIGTATSGLVEHLRATGHRVTVLYTQVSAGVPLCTDRSWQHWTDALAAAGIRLVAIPHRGSYFDWREKALLVHDFLADHAYDVVYFNEHHGSGYYAMAAKRAGLEPFRAQTHVVVTHGAIEWVANVNDQPLVGERDVEMAMLERRCAEWADFIIGPSAYLLGEYERYGWSLPPNAFVLPYALERETPPERDRSPRRVDELVFFGRLETRKGLWLFCEALDRIAGRLGGVRVTFMGRMTDVAGVPAGLYVLERAARWPFAVQLVTEFGQDEALAYLREPGRAAVMPSLADNSPCVVYECMEHGIPFVTCSGSGADELVDAVRSPGALVAPSAEALARRLLEIVRDGAAPAAPAFDYAANWAAWTRWHNWLGNAPRPAAAAAPAMPARPLAVLVDAGDLPFHGVVASAARHAERFGAELPLFVLSPRDQALLDETALTVRGSGWPGVLAADAVVFRSTENAGEDALRDRLETADAAFVFGPGLALRRRFADAAGSLLAQGRADAASCLAGGEAAGVRPPLGDAGAGAMLAGAMTAGAFAFAPRALAGLVRSMTLVRPEDGVPRPARALAEELLRRASAQGGTVAMLPVIGADVAAEDAVPLAMDHGWWREARDLAAELGVAAGTGVTAPAWGVVSSDAARRARDRALSTPALPEAARRLCHLEPEPAAAWAPRLAELAAVGGNLDRAVQIALAHGAAGSATLAHVFETARRTMRSARGFSMPVHAVYGPSFVAYGTAAYVHGVDDGFVVHAGDAGGAAVRLLVTEVPLAGATSAAVTVSLPPHARGGVLASLRVFDETRGQPLASLERVLQPGAEQRLELALPGVTTFTTWAFASQLAEDAASNEFAQLAWTDWDIR